jgi:hypothetical protein
MKPDPKLMRIILLDVDIINYFKKQVHKMGGAITNS